MKPVLPHLLVASALVASLTESASAVDYIFNGGTADWSTAGAWTPSGPPGGGTGNFAYVNSGTVNITADTASIQDPFIGRGAGTNGTVNQTAGTHSNVGWTFIGTDGGTGAWNVTGSGSMNTGRIYVGGQRELTGGNGSMLIDTTGSITATSDFSVASRGAQGSVVMNKGTVTANTWMIIGESHSGSASVGSFTQNGGSVNVGATDANGRLWLGSNENGAAAAGTKGQYFLNGGTLASNNIWVGKDYEGVFTQAAGTTFTIRGTGDDSRIGANAGSTGTYTMTGGTLNVSGNFQIGASGSGTFNMSGGSAGFNSWPVIGRFGGGNGQANISGGTFTQNDGATRLIVGEDGTGTVTLSGSGSLVSNGGLSLGHNAGGNGTVNLNGGTLTAPLVQKGNTAIGTAKFNFNGGTLKASATNADYFLRFNSADLEIKSGGAIIDTNGNAIGITQALGGAGGLTKQGLGTLTLTGANTYVGNTTINAGTLLLSGSGSIATSPTILVKQGATLDTSALASWSVAPGQNLTGKGTVAGTVTTGANSNIAPGESPGTLVISGGLDLTGGSSSTGWLDFELGATSGGTSSDQITVSGTLTIGSGLVDWNDFTFIQSAGFPGGELLTSPITYTLIDAGTISGTLGGTLYGTIGRYNAGLSVDPITQNIVLTVVPEPAVLGLGAMAGLTVLRRRRRSA